MEQDLRALGIVHEGAAHAGCVTVSIGVTTTGGEGDYHLALLALADEQLYEAKRAGRGRACGRSEPAAGVPA